MGFKQRLLTIIEAPVFGRFITGVIIFNAMLLGMETAPSLMERFGPAIVLLDSVCLAIFVAEIGAKLVASGRRFFTSGWNIFDFVIVGIALVPGEAGLSVLRALRILRVLRVIS
ncbi:MAG: ion transporter, partial [Pseudomonadota bacterium]